MGFFGSTFSLLAGTVCGIYIAQNYTVPDIKQVVNNGILKLKDLESKSDKKGDS